jgi:SAM-dependent methyltransferase
MSDPADIVSAASRDLRGSPDRFGWEWDAYAEIFPEYEEQFRRWTVHLRPEDWRGKSFLDVGCGMGRNSYWPMQYGACSCVAVDIDDRSLASARRNLARFPNVVIQRCSAFDMPFESQFDIVFSIGVIHHLEFPETALARIVRAVRPGGHVMIWVYGSENNRWLVSVFNPLRKALFSRLPVRLTHHLSLYPAAFLWLLLHVGVRPIEYFRLLSRFDFRHLRSIVFDQMLPRIAHYWSREEVLVLMQGAGLQDIRLAWVNQMSWSAIGTRPLKASNAK